MLLVPRDCHGSTPPHLHLSVRERDVVMPVVPMFHANAWGLCHGTIAAGSNLVFPGRNLSGPHLVRGIALLTALVPPYACAHASPLHLLCSSPNRPR